MMGTVLGKTSVCVCVCVETEPHGHHDSPAAAMVTNPPEGLWVVFFFLDGVFFLNICILILYM